MDAVVLHSDIARLVLGYLKRQNLEPTSRLFCKTSPHLKQEFSAYKKGFTPHSFGPNLEDIICEYVNISRTVESIVSSLPSNLRLQLFECKLSEKVKLLLEQSLDSYLKIEQSKSATPKKSDTKHSSAASTSLHSNKENSTKKHDKQKRKRALLLSSSDERKSPVELRNKLAKRRRILEPFCYLSGKKHNLRQQKTLNTSSTGEGQTQTDDGIEQESADEEGTEFEEEVANVIDNDSDLSFIEKPTKESTPRNKSVKGKFLAPSVPELSQAILDNPHFQMKLVDNINQALCTSTEAQSGLSSMNTLSTNVPPSSDTLSEEQQIINSNEVLDRMVKDILKATEQDPAFDAIIENVVGASVTPANVSAGVQCNIDSSALQPLLSMATVPAVVGQQQEPQHFTLVQQQQQQIPCLSAISHEMASSTSAPRTPLIIRNAVATASASLSGGCSAVAGGGESQLLSALTANNSFGSLIDPNFSISKLIVLNPNDSAQKQRPSADQSIDNTTADHLINQLTSGTATTLDEQVYFDANTGQLTIPLFLTDEGLLANFPFLVNNEVISQLQPDNICNMDGSRIEIPLPEPIIFSADQLPPNSIILTSSQKAITVEEQRLPGAQPPRTVCKKPKDGPAPSSLNARSNADGETPSTSGIVNTKTSKSLSTPRKHTSHVRTLSFSPKIETNRAIVEAYATTHSARHAVQRDTADVPKATTVEEETTKFSTDVPERPIIKNVEILPRLDGPIDMSANESSNSCSVPHLFVTDESSNKTVIKTELSFRKKKEVGASVKAMAATNSKQTIVDQADTPKRKQVRRSAVRACKRQLSKSSDESDKSKLVNQSEKSKSNESPSESEEKIKEQKQAKENDDKMMDEWLRLRNANTSDLDSRLRQLNADQYIAVPKSARRKRVTPGNKRKLRRKKPVITKRTRKKAMAALAMLDLKKRKGDLDASVEFNKTKMVNESEHKPKVGIRIRVPTPKYRVGTEKRESSAEEVPDAVVSTALQQTNKKTQCNPIVQRSEERLEQERVRRTANIACLLDTPFKPPITVGEVPPTPGIPVPSLDTPASKLGEFPFSTSYIFGSDTKSVLETPQQSAVTPGFRFTPFGSSRDVTPRSIAPTADYSSGGSYYKPDESDDLDRNFDKLLKDSAQKQKQEEEEKARMQEHHSNAAEVKNELFEQRRQSPERDAEKKVDAICVEIPAEKLRVEPIVLKRVKSFGAESTENGEGDTAPLNIDPHYTLVSELPEICAEEESSNSSTFSSSSSSSSNSSSTSSSTISGSSADAHKEEAAAGADNEHKTPEKLNLSLDNLSSISSTEDGEWQKLAVTEEENSQLVGNDGEVRYPVRSWLTPSKVDKQPTADAQERTQATIIKVTVPLKSVEKRNRLENDLQQKRERMMVKLKEDASQRHGKKLKVSSTPPSGITAALSATRKITAIREKAKIQPKKISMQTVTSTISEPNPTKSVVVVEEQRTIEVLTALQLSARKPQQPSVGEPKTRTPAVPPTMSGLNDNAMPMLFTNASTSTAYELTEKTERLPLKKLISKVKSKQRQCVQIKPLPALKPSRSSAVVRKKIVRKPLGFKGTPAHNAAEDVEHIKELKSPFRLAAKSVVKDEREKSTGISSVTKIKIKNPTGPTTITASTLRVSPRLRENKKQKGENSDLDEEEGSKNRPLNSPKTLKITKTTTPKRSLKACIKVTPVRTRITGSKKAAQKVGFKIEKKEFTTDESCEVEVMPTDEVQEKIHVDEIKPNKQEHAKGVEKKKSEKKRCTDRIKEGQQAGKISKQKSKIPFEAAKSAKDVEYTKSTDPLVSSEAAARIVLTEAKPTKSETHLPERATVTADNLEKGAAAKNEDMPLKATAIAEKIERTTAAKKEDMPLRATATSEKLGKDTSAKKEDVPQRATAATEKLERGTAAKKEELPQRATVAVDYLEKGTAAKMGDMLKRKIRTTDKDNIAADIPKAKASKVEHKKVQKAETSNRSKLNVETVFTENIETQYKAREKDEITQKENSAEAEIAQTIVERTTTPTSTTNAEPTTTETSEDDPLEGCGLVSVTDDDPVRFISVTYSGPDEPPRNALPRRDFSNFKMVVAFDEDEKHFWRVTDELMLFHASPATQQIRNIPKKRKVRINTCGSDQDNVATVGIVHSTTTTLATTSATTSMTIVSSSDNAKSASNSSREAKPIATSTPISAPATSSTQGSKKLVSKITKTAADAASTSSLSTKATAKSTTEVLQMDDIESLLSHLHGKENY